MSEKQIQQTRNRDLARRLKLAMGGIPTLQLVTAKEAEARSVTLAQRFGRTEEARTAREVRILAECRKVHGEGGAR